MIALAVVVPLAAAGGLFGLGPSEARTINNTTRTSVNRTVNANRNVDTQRDVDIDVDVDRGWDVGRAVATRAAATAAVTSAVVGSMVRTLPPACQTVMVDGFAYQNCDGVWYQPQYAGANVTYVVVVPPR